MCEWTFERQFIAKYYLKENGLLLNIPIQYCLQVYLCTLVVSNLTTLVVSSLTTLLVSNLTTLLDSNFTTLLVSNLTTLLDSNLTTLLVSNLTTLLVSNLTTLLVSNFTQLMFHYSLVQSECGYRLYCEQWSLSPFTCCVTTNPTSWIAVLMCT